MAKSRKTGDRGLVAAPVAVREDFEENPAPAPEEYAQAAIEMVGLTPTEN
jgi:hypothetical protein